MKNCLLCYLYVENWTMKGMVTKVTVKTWL